MLHDFETRRIVTTVFKYTSYGSPHQQHVIGNNGTDDR
jgi:hypothetical protein